ISWRRRAAFMVAAIVVPILANGMRAFGTIYAAWWTSVEAATGFDHIVYGWVFFALVMAAVLAIGWKWFDRDPDARWFDPARLQTVPARRVDAPVAGLLVLLVASLFLGWSSLNDARAAPV
ncbi:archaeosortase/exosortase family protein, partial [Escherichia coli]|nr:archaeosortase/exosortase family protein [Escherichia coli]